MRKTKLILVILTCLLLLFSPLQKQFRLFRFKPLKGVFEPTPKPELTFDSYRSGVYQTQTEKYLSENFGFREPLIRFYNQYDFSFFNNTHCHFITPGKDGYLFYDQAVNDYFGTEVPKHFDTDDDLRAKADKEVDLMKQLQTELHKYGIEFMTFLAPDKPWVYPEYLPKHPPRLPDAVNTVEYYDQKMTEAGIPHIEMTKWYQQMKDTASFDIFTKTDSHWRYAAVYGYDSLFRYMNSLNDFGIPKIHIGPVQSYTTDLLEGDEETLNLMFPIKGTSTKYKADITIESDSTTRKPRVLFVGDSFIWSLETFMPWSEIMEDVEIWFYNSTAYVGFQKEAFKVSDINRLASILNADFVVYYAAGHQWWQTSFGFLEDAIGQLNVSDSIIRLTQQMNVIRNDRKWKAAIRIQASIQNLSIDEVLRQEALNVIGGKPLLRDVTPVDSASIIRVEKERIEKSWRGSKEIMTRMEQKAEERGISVDSMLYLDIDWIINNKIENGELTFDAADSSPVDEAIIEAEKRRIEKNWRNSPEIMNMIMEKARKNDLPFDTMLKMDIEWIINQEIENGELASKRLIDTAAIIKAEKEKIEMNWRGSPEIMNMIMEKALKNDLPFDTMLKMDIEWIINQEIENGELY